MTELGLLGPANTYHDITRKRYLPHLSYRYFFNFNDIFEALNNGTIGKALVAVKNSSSGLVNDNLERISQDYSHLETFELPINLCLGSAFPNTVASIKKIFSHHMAIKETQHYFSKYHHITFIASASTAGAVDELLNNKEKHAAVISSKEAIEANKLLLLAENIEDERNNATTFYLISRKL